MKRFLLCCVLAAAAILPGGAASCQTRKDAGAGAALDYPAFLDRLRKSGASLEEQGEAEQPFLSVSGRMIKIAGEDVQVFQYPAAGAMESDAARISRDGLTIGKTKPHWIGPPHFYKQGRLLVLYVGDDSGVLKILASTLGRQFAGK